MSQATMEDRLLIKTPEATFLHILHKEFNFSKRVSQEVLSAAQEMLRGNPAAAAARPGQTPMIVASLKAPFGPPLSETDKVEASSAALWTLCRQAGSRTTWHRRFRPVVRPR